MHEKDLCKQNVARDLARSFIIHLLIFGIAIMPPQALVVYSSGQILRRGLKFVLANHQERMARWQLDRLVRKFQIFYGCHPKDCQRIWYALQQTTVAAARVPRSKLKLDYFLMAFYFLRTYETQEQIESKFPFCRETIDTWLWYYLLRKVQRLKEEKIVWPEEWNNDPGNPFCPYFLFSVDGTHCRVMERQTPTYNRDNAYYSHKFHGAGLNYEVALHCYENKIVHIKGPDPAGRGDKAAFRDELHGKIPAGSRAVADNGYRADDLDDSLALPNAHAPKPVRKFLQRARARHETLYSRMKVFSVLSDRFRCKHPHDRDPKHKTCFEAVAVIIQFQMENDSPLFCVDHL